MIYTKVKCSWCLPKLAIPIKVPTMEGFKIEYMEDYPVYKYEEVTLKGNIKDEDISLYIKEKFLYYTNLKIISIERYYYDNDGKKFIT